MKILLCYIAVTRGRNTHELAARFVGTYCQFPPLVEHETVVACNGGPLPFETHALFTPLSNVQFKPRVNDRGWDISAYQDIAKETDAEMILCLGESCYFHRAGWMVPLVEAWRHYGPGIYGFWSSYSVRPHLNTTGFAIAPEDLRAYPRVREKQDRYDFEHGFTSIWRRLYAKDKPAMLVTWDGVYPPLMWRYPKNILWRGDQRNCLLWCGHTERYANADTARKQRWANNADTLKEKMFHSQYSHTKRMKGTPQFT